MITTVHRATVLALLLLISQSNLAVTKNGFDLSDSLIPAEHIERGGPPRDGIPSIDNPEFIPAAEARFLRSKDRVIGVHRNGVAKAYPIKILNWHEIVNDSFADEPVLISYCPLCNTGMVFAVGHAEVTFTFGVSGLLYNSDVLLYDRQTGSLWSQIMSKAIAGPLKGVTLPAIPARHTTWRDWREQYPDSVVLSRNTGFRRDYGKSPYLGYATSRKLFFGVTQESTAYRRKELVLGVALDGQYKAYPFGELEEHGAPRFLDEFAGQTLTVEWLARDRTARLFSQDGEELASVLAYWFAWYAFHPNTEVFRAPVNPTVRGGSD